MMQSNATELQLIGPGRCGLVAQLVVPNSQVDLGENRSSILGEAIHFNPKNEDCDQCSVWIFMVVPPVLITFQNLAM